VSDSSRRGTFPPDAIDELTSSLREANSALAVRYPGESLGRQPVHVVYGGAHLFRADTVPQLGVAALESMARFAPDSATFSPALNLPPTSELSDVVYRRVLQRLREQPVEDYRLDFEDGYGNRPDAEEDGHAASAAREVALASRQGTLPRAIGIRIKPLTEELRVRSLRTLDIFVTTLHAELGGRLPNGFIITLPKVTLAEQVRLFSAVLGVLEQRLTLDAMSLRYEIMIETPQAVIDARGINPMPGFLDAAGGRMIAAHFGTYDYTAGLSITAAHQRMRHDVCDFARHMMQVAYAGTGVWLSDGSTGVLPVPPHRAEAGQQLGAEQEDANRRAVHVAWRMHYDDVRHSLVNGFYQGWDLHPAQLPSRYAALYVFFMEGLQAAGDRLRNFLAKASQATVLGDTFDDAATGQALHNYFLRAMNCGAIGESDAEAMSGLTGEELRGRSFVTILRRRLGRAGA
jgi:citrate lyase beta subunit